MNTFYGAMDESIAAYEPSNADLTPAQVIAAKAAMNASQLSARNNVVVAYQTFDYALAALAFVLIIGGIISSFRIPAHPVFLVINIIGIFLLVFIGMIMTNIYAELVSGEGADYIGTAADNFGLINYLMQYLPYIGAVSVAISSIVMFSRGM